MNQSVALQLSGGGLAHVLSDVLQPASQTVVAGTLYATYLGLFTAWPGFGLGLTLSQLTEATYTGYARRLIAWGDEGVDLSQRPDVFSSAQQFQPSGAGVSNTIIGAFLADALAGGNLLAVGLLLTPIILANSNNVLTLVPRFAVPGLAAPDWGEIVGIA